MNLGDKQRLFARLIAELIIKAYEMGYQVTLGEAYRTPYQAKQYAEQGIGIENSLHTQKLALDINLFKNGKYLNRNQDYEPIGEVWESMSGAGYELCWGGRFGDGNHFSCSHLGVR